MARRPAGRPALNARLCPFMLATMIGSIRLPAALQIRVFDHLQETITHEPGDTALSRVWPILLPVLHDYVGVVSVRAMQGGLSDLAPLVTEFAALLFREFHEQAVAERLLEVATSLDPALRADPFHRSTYYAGAAGQIRQLRDRGLSRLDRRDGAHRSQPLSRGLPRLHGAYRRQSGRLPFDSGLAVRALKQGL